jgi:hypothetical protein
MTDPEPLWRVRTGDAEPVTFWTQKGARTSATIRNGRPGRPGAVLALVEHRDSVADPWHDCPGAERIPRPDDPEPRDAWRRLAEAQDAHALRPALPGFTDPRPPSRE